MTSSPYTSRYFEGQRAGSRATAQLLVPYLCSLLKPRSVIDVGCGVGTWAHTFQEHGVLDVWGVDGSYVDLNLMEIPIERFIMHDLAQPLHLDRRFDLACCFEVAEHLPESSADVIVQSLVSLAPAVAFSAAIPGQGGTAHVNEQWQGYWADKFLNHGYARVDCLRGIIWNSRQAAWWYAQNAILYVDVNSVDTPNHLIELAETSSMFPDSLVHPEFINQKHVRFAITLISATPQTIKRIVRPIAKRF